MCELNIKGKKFLIVSGGTGGHIFPAIVFGRWLESHGASVAWLSDSRPLAKEIYNSNGIQPYLLSIAGSPLGVRRPKEIFRRSLHLISAFRETSRCLAQTKAELVFLFGGYVSFAPLLVCRKQNIPVIIHEQNAIAGRVTRLASRMKALVTSGWSECLGIHKSFTHVGIPVREPHYLERFEALSKLGFDKFNFNPDTRIVGVAGGSLGSKPLTEKLMAAAKIFEQRDTQVKFILLSDGDNQNAPDNVFFVGRQWDMNPLYSLCDVLVCRAGGSTLAESLVWGIPTVVIPWEGAAEGHQRENARCFVQTSNGAGVMWLENQNENDAASLADAIAELLTHKNSRLEHEELKLKSETACRALARAAGFSSAG